MKTVSALVCLILCFFISSVSAEEYCIYTNEQGTRRKVKSIRQIPSHLKRTASCITSQQITQQGSRRLVSPEDIELKGSLRKQRINSSVGAINLRWPRSAEEVLGRDPMRAMADAGRMVSKALKREGFPSKFSNLNLEWEVVFMDENVPIDQVPMHLISNCHPAWMTPPSNIYVVVQRVAAGCGGSPAPGPKEVDAKMAEVLAHEMGHVVEAHILGRGAFGGERWRAEGFATFFERIASEYSMVIPDGAVARSHRKLARQSFQASPKSFNFRGTSQDYARASMYIEAVTEDRGVKGLMRVYDRLKSGQPSIMSAIKEETGWSSKQIEDKAREVAGF